MNNKIENRNGLIDFFLYKIYEGMKDPLFDSVVKMGRKFDEFFPGKVKDFGKDFNGKKATIYGILTGNRKLSEGFYNTFVIFLEKLSVERNFSPGVLVSMKIEFKRICDELSTKRENLRKETQKVRFLSSGNHHKRVMPEKPDLIITKQTLERAGRVIESMGGKVTFSKFILILDLLEEENEAS